MIALSALNRKLVRDLWRLRGQVFAVSLVVSAGVGVLVMSLTALTALSETATAYYERYRFADVFALVKRAPEHVARHIAELPGVQSVETRISRLAIIDVEGFDEPVVGRLISIPERGEPLLNRLALREGRYVAPRRLNEIVLSEPFAMAHGLGVGDDLKVLMNGNKRHLEIVGIALSPEFVYAIAPGSLMPDDERFGVGWMGREALEAAYDLDGAFNDVSLTLMRGVDAEQIALRLDQILARYGGVRAYSRDDQISNWFLMNELEQLRAVSTILPTIFLAVAVFLTNTLLSRIIATERGEIGLMKAFGYSNFEVGWHYVKLVIAMTAIGILLGFVVGAWMGRVNTVMYSEIYRFPFLYFRPDPRVFAFAAALSLAAALLGTLRSVLRAARLPPAEAMQPPTPPSFQRSWLATSRLLNWLDQPTRILVRQIGRWPLRAGLTCIGVSMSIGILVMANQWMDSIDEMVGVYFHHAQRQNVTVALVEPQSVTSLFEFQRLPGVMAAEPARIVSTDFSVGTRQHRGSIEAIASGAALQRIYDAGSGALPVPPQGLVMSSMLARKLGVKPGDEVDVTIREGRQPQLRIEVVRLFETHIGMPAYMSLHALNRLLREPPSLEYVHLFVDPADQSALFSALKEYPEIAAVTTRRAAIDTFNETLADTLLIYISFYSLFASALGFGVVYNSARIALSERGHELGTLRVLGFSRGETAYILLGEVGLLIVLALPLGCLVGRRLAIVMSSAFETELYRVPPVIEHSTYGLAVIVALVATVISAALVRRRLDSLDMVAVLKARE